MAEQKGEEGSRRVDADEILMTALAGLDGVTDALSDRLLAELRNGDGNRAERIRDAIRDAADG